MSKEAICKVSMLVSEHLRGSLHVLVALAKDSLNMGCLSSANGGEEKGKQRKEDLAVILSLLSIVISCHRDDESFSSELAALRLPSILLGALAGARSTLQQFVVEVPLRKLLISLFHSLSVSFRVLNIQSRASFRSGEASSCFADKENLLDHQKVRSAFTGRVPSAVLEAESMLRKAFKSAPISYLETDSDLESSISAPIEESLEDLAVRSLF